MNESRLFHYIGSERVLDDARENIVKLMIEEEIEWEVNERDEIVCRKSERKSQYYVLVTSKDHKESILARVVLVAA
ncbi:hypothetical protein AGMMS49944_16250 [Spirochaetia bacterium]|nr:hypothetical protein AGMMS49944_16250 [Spirochaetia bacterium]